MLRTTLQMVTGDFLYLLMNEPNIFLAGQQRSDLNSHIIYLMFLLPFCLQTPLNVMFWLRDWIIDREIHIQVNLHPWISSGDLTTHSVLT